MTKKTLYTQALEKATGSDPDYEAAAPLLEKAAEAGSAEALYAIGSWYFHGRYYPRDVPKGIKYWKKAADAGATDAMLELGKLYERNDPVKKDLKKAFYHYLRAALAGDGQACYEVGRFFYYGFFVPKSEKVSDIWRDKAEEFGFVEPDDE